MGQAFLTYYIALDGAREPLYVGPRTEGCNDGAYDSRQGPAGAVWRRAAGGVAASLDSLPRPRQLVSRRGGRETHMGRADAARYRALAHPAFRRGGASRIATVERTAERGRARANSPRADRTANPRGG